MASGAAKGGGGLRIPFFFRGKVARVVVRGRTRGITRGQLACQLQRAFRLPGPGRRFDLFHQRVAQRRIVYSNDMSRWASLTFPEAGASSGGDRFPNRSRRMRLAQRGKGRWPRQSRSRGKTSWRIVTESVFLRPKQNISLVRIGAALLRSTDVPPETFPFLCLCNCPWRNLLCDRIAGGARPAFGK